MVLSHQVCNLIHFTYQPQLFKFLLCSKNLNDYFTFQIRKTCKSNNYDFSVYFSSTVKHINPLCSDLYPALESHLTFWLPILNMFSFWFVFHSPYLCAISYHSNSVLLMTCLNTYRYFFDALLWHRLLFDYFCLCVHCAIHHYTPAAVSCLSFHISSISKKEYLKAKIS